mgnify:CR=1 FL=1
MPDKLILPKDDFDGTFLWLLWDKPPVDHPMNKSGNVNIIARLRSAWAIDADIPSDTYGRYGEYNATTNPNGWDKEFYSKGNAIKVGKRLADWFEYQSLYKGKGQAHKGMYGGAIFIHNWGCQTEGSTLFKEIEDHASDCLTIDDFVGYKNATEAQALHSKLKYSVGFTKNSIAKSTTESVVNGKTILGISKWMETAMLSMKAECDARNLCYPLYLAQDHENFEPYLFKLVGYDRKPALDALASDFPKEWASAPWRAAMADPRFATETVYEEWDGKQWIGKTLKDAYTEAGLPVFKNGEFFVSPTNNEFTRKMAPYIAKICDYALSKMLYEPIKKVFPNIQCGNYNIVMPTSSEPQNIYFDVMNNWMFQPSKVFTNAQPSGKKHFHGDFSSPVCYSPVLKTGTQTIYRYDPSEFNPNFNADYTKNPAGVRGHPFGSTPQDIYRNFIKQRVRSLTVNNPTACIPWIECPGAKVADSNIYMVHTSTVDDLLDITTDNYKNGVRVWQLFNAFWPAAQLSSSHELHDKLHTWIKTNQPPATIQPQTVQLTAVEAPVEEIL